MAKSVDSVTQNAFNEYMNNYIGQQQQAARTQKPVDATPKSIYGQYWSDWKDTFKTSYEAAKVPFQGLYTTVDYLWKGITFPFRKAKKSIGKGLSKILPYGVRHPLKYAKEFFGYALRPGKYPGKKLAFKGVR